MDKEQRRGDYQKKNHYLKAQKRERKVASNLEEGIEKRINQLTLKELIKFLKEEYSQYLEQNEELIAKLNKTIAKQYCKIKKQWADFHKALFFEGLKTIGIDLSKQNFQKFVKGEYFIYKLREYGVNIYNQQNYEQTRFINFYCHDKSSKSSRRTYTYKYFYLIQGTYLQQARIDNKGFKNNAICMCQHLSKVQEYVNFRVSPKTQK